MSTPDSEHSDALDELYEALTEVHAHLHTHAQEREQLLAEIDKLQRQLMDQRDAAAKAGERETYNRLSEDLARLTRAYRVASEDPDADPLEQYQPDDSEPEDQPQDQEDDDGPEAAGPAGDSDAAGSAGEPAPEAGQGDRGAGDQEQRDDRAGGANPDRGIAKRARRRWFGLGG